MEKQKLSFNDLISEVYKLESLNKQHKDKFDWLELPVIAHHSEFIVNQLHEFKKRNELFLYDYNYKQIMIWSCEYYKHNSTTPSIEFENLLFNIIDLLAEKTIDIQVLFKLLDELKIHQSKLNLL